MVRAICVACVLVAFGVGVISAADPAVPAEGQRAISAFLRESVSRGEVPGVVAMVVGRDRILYHEAFGKQDVARDLAMQKDSIFRIASMTKPMTSAAIMMLVEEGKLGLDDPVSQVPAAVRPAQGADQLRRRAGDVRDAARDEGHDDPAPAHAHVGHRLQLVRSGPGRGAARDQGHQRQRTAARQRARRAMELRRQHAGARRHRPGGDQPAHRRLPAGPAGGSARHDGDGLRCAGGEARPRGDRAPTNQRQAGGGAQSRFAGGGRARRWRALQHGERLRALHPADPQSRAGPAAAGCCPATRSTR